MSDHFHEDEHEHIHEHEHDHDHEHTHKHGHTHDHDHDHEHHAFHQHITPEAVLQHMLEHNRSHADELEAIASQVTGDAAAKIAEAVASMRAGNDRLAEALEIMKEA